MISPTSVYVFDADVTVLITIRYRTPDVPAVTFCTTVLPEIEGLPESNELGLASVPSTTEAELEQVDRVSPEASTLEKSNTNGSVSVVNLSENLAAILNPNSFVWCTSYYI